MGKLIDMRIFFEIERECNLASAVSSLPVCGRGGKILAHAKVDADMYDKLSKYTWLLSDKGTIYRLTDKGSGAASTSFFLHREVFGCQYGDGQTVIFKDGDKLNCLRSNLVAGIKKTYTRLLRGPKGKSFPYKPESFISYFRKHYPAFDDVLYEAQITQYSRKRIVFSFEGGTDGIKRAKHHSFRDGIRRAIEDDFGFEIDIQVVERIPPSELAKPSSAPTESHPKPSPSPPPSPLLGSPYDAMMADTFEAFRAGRINDVNLGFAVGDEKFLIRLLRSRGETPKP